MYLSLVAGGVAGWFVDHRAVGVFVGALIASLAAALLLPLVVGADRLLQRRRR